MPLEMAPPSEDASATVARTPTGTVESNRNPSGKTGGKPTGGVDIDGE
jgi:hypothetical protein